VTAQEITVKLCVKN